MARNTEPKLIAPESMQEPERASLALFLATVQANAAETAGVIRSYDSPTELMAAAESVNGGEATSDHILRVAGPVFAAEIDLDVDVDSETAAAMRRGIDTAARQGATVEQRRILRMAIFSGEVATWQESNDLMAHVEDGGPSAISQGDYRRPELVISYIDDPLPETA